MNCLVTGATGLIGFELCKLLLEKEMQVFGLSRSENPPRFAELSKNKNFHAVSGDITNKFFTRSLFEKYEINFVFHMAVERFFPDAKTEATADLQNTIAFKTNFLGTVNLLEGAANQALSGWIQSSTMNVYPFENLPEIPVDETCPPAPAEPNGMSMLLAEQACTYFSNRAHFPMVLLRYPGVYGMGKNRGIVAKFVQQCLENQNGELTAVTDRSSDFVFSKDIALANVTAMDRIDQLDGKIINVGSGQETYIPDLARMVKEITHSNLSISEKISGKPRRFLMDIERAKKLLDYQPRSVYQGLSEYIEDFKKAKEQQ
ncbi:MAG: SDR family NAD(P)-dependent oxidoreductase [Calditrichaeota bacterium]|nr:MAG: SDR family NAD(P)-dependent oxidoreductase [Calditrichota bacterium]